MEKLVEKPKCIRCGVCCMICPCDIGELALDEETGLCSLLTIHKEGYTSCKYIERKGNIFAGGCSLRRYPKFYEKYKKLAEKIVGTKLVGIKVMEINSND